MDAEQYTDALRDRAQHLYCVLMMDPLRVPLLTPMNKGYYPPSIVNERHMRFWLELTDELQIIKPSNK